jgi:hypothetical protein
VLQGAEELFRANRIKAGYLDSYKERAIEQFSSRTKFCAAR